MVILVLKQFLEQSHLTLKLQGGEESKPNIPEKFFKKKKKRKEGGATDNKNHISHSTCAEN